MGYVNHDYETAAFTAGWRRVKDMQDWHWLNNNQGIEDFDCRTAKALCEKYDLLEEES